MEDRKLSKQIWEGYWKEKSEQNNTNIEQYYSSYSGRNICKALNLLLPDDLGGKKVLDVGCGEGLYFNLLKQKGSGIFFGIDDNEKILKLCKLNNPFVNTLIADVNDRLPFEDNYFDVVMSFGLIEHFSNPEVVLSNFSRILKKDGILILEMPNKLNPGTFLKFNKYSERQKLNWVQWWGPLEFSRFIKNNQNLRYNGFTTAVLFSYKTNIFRYYIKRFLVRICRFNESTADNFLDNVEFKLPFKYFGHAMFISVKKKANIK